MSAELLFLISMSDMGTGELTLVYAYYTGTLIPTVAV